MQIKNMLSLRMNSVLSLILYMLLIISINFNKSDGKTQCYQCQGTNCFYKTNWGKCSGDACFKGNPEKLYKSFYEKSKHTVITNQKNINIFNSDKHHVKSTMKSTTKFHYPTKMTTKDFFKFHTPSKTTSHIFLFKSTTKPTTKTTLIATNKPTTKTTLKATTKSYKPDTKNPTAKTFTIKKGHTSKRHKRSSNYDRGCIMEKDIPKLGCHNKFCVCLKDLCNDQPKIINNAFLLIFSCLFTIRMLSFHQ